MEPGQESKPTGATSLNRHAFLAQVGSAAGFAIVPSCVLAMGNLALRFPGVLLRWDTTRMCFTNLPEANKFLHRPYREGWVL